MLLIVEDMTDEILSKPTAAGDGLDSAGGLTMRFRVGHDGECGRILNFFLKLRGSLYKKGLVEQRDLSRAVILFLFLTFGCTI